MVRHSERAGGRPAAPRMLALFDAMPSMLQVDWPDDMSAAEWREALRDDAHRRHAEAAKVVQAFVSGLAKRYRNRPDRLNQDRLDWLRFFRQNYQKIVAMAEGE